QKEQKKFRENLAKGDKVITIGGIHGKITEVKDDSTLIEIAPNVIVKVEKSAISADFTSNNISQEKK
ncbi:MAG: preprotein translocase subunit YajC, partial [Flavobacteriales bacterium]|nr:preprotein translocase subunit YajC [Flavobacteriales bacterium]